MNIYFDTEFTGLHRDTTLISIGMIAENGETFYAECNDYDKSQCDDWIKENVISNLIADKPEFWEDCVADYQVFGSRFDVVYLLKTWLRQFSDVQFVSDVCHYDFVLLIDLFGEAFDLPDNVNPACHDINQDIARYLNISETEAFDMDREEILRSNSVSIPDGDKHNSLYDAEVIKLLYELMYK